MLAPESKIYNIHALLLDSEISDSRHTAWMLVMKIKIHGRHACMLASKISASRHTADASAEN